jgi:hypothetical protein
MSNYELNEILLNTLTDIATEALKLKSEVDTEDKNILRRLDNLN